MSTPTAPWRLALALWLLGLPGIVAVTFLALPQLLPPGPPPAPMPVIMAAAAFQSALLLALSAWLGGAAASRVGLRSPLVEALLRREPMPAVRPAIIAGLAGGAAGALLLLSLPAWTPAGLATVQQTVSLPLAVRVLYGGLTEEVLIRWGLMSGIVWLLWRTLQAGRDGPNAAVVALAVLVSSVLFGAGHLPAAAALVGSLDAGIVLYIVVANALFGLVAGFLFWRHGLECAMLAHVVAHAGAYAIAG